MSFLLKVPSLELPQALPSAIALASCKQNAGAYEPWFWEAEYMLNRYLERLPIDKLFNRHTDILKNLSRLATGQYTHVPSLFFQSDWYWFRKEHQTRLECQLRGVQPHLNINETSLTNKSTGQLQTNTLGDPKVIFRYMEKQFAEEMRDTGRVRVAPAESYRDFGADNARADDELTKSTILSGARIKITDSSGTAIKVSGDINVDHSGENYHVICFANAWDTQLFTDFQGSTHCVVVHDIETFAQRLETAGRHHFEDWYFHHNPVMYFDPHEATLGDHIDHAMYKDFKFAYQQEYRFIWSDLSNKSVSGEKFLELGSLTDIVTVVQDPEINRRQYPHKI